MLFPLSVSYVALVSTQTGLIDENMRLSLLAIMLSLISSAAIMRAAALENAAERAEVAQEARLQNLLDGIGAHIFAIGPDGQVQFANRQAQELTRKAGSPQRWLTETPFVGGAGMTPLAAEDYPLARLLREEEPEAMRLAYPDEKGELVHLRALRGEYTGLQGERIQTLALRDVTEDTRIRAKLARSAQLDSLGRLSGGIAHDIANLLGIIRLSADVGQISDDPTAMKAQFESVQRACIRGAELTDRILAFAQRQPGQDEAINLSALVRDVFGFVGRMISSDLDFRLDVPMEDIHVTCDPGQLENALINLVLNARDALRTGDADVGRIVLGVVMEQDRPVVFVSDNGPGMSDYIRQHATDPFYTTRQDDGGTGLGLSIVEAFSLHAGADMQIDSAPGKGTRVSLKFPPTSRTSLELAVGTMAEKVEGLSGLRILVVEDDAAFRQSVNLFLTGQGAKVVSVGTGGAAMEVLAEADLDVLLTDITMAGGVDGFAVARAAVERRPDFPIVYLSGYADPEIAEADRPRGTFLKKPVSGADLSRAIRAAI